MAEGHGDQAENQAENSGSPMTMALMIIAGGLALAALAIGILLLISSSHMTMPAKCSPLEDPIIEEKENDDDEDPVLYRASVRVTVSSTRGGWGKAILSPESTVYDSAGDRWHKNDTLQMEWASAYCLCPGCNGTSPGVCEECVPGAKGCDVLPPEYDCWVDVRTRGAGFPVFDTGVGRVRFEKEKAERNTAWWISFWVFLGIFIALLIAFVGVSVPQMLSSASSGDYEQMPHTA
jgi:hypothetical protein